MALEPTIYFPKHIPHEAVRWTGNLDDLPLRWKTSGFFRVIDGGLLSVTTTNRIAIAEIGDMITRDAGGSFYPVKAAIWAAHYEEAQTNA